MSGQGTSGDVQQMAESSADVAGKVELRTHRVGVFDTDYEGNELFTKYEPSSDVKTHPSKEQGTVNLEITYTVEASMSLNAFEQQRGLRNDNTVFDTLVVKSFDIIVDDVSILPKEISTVDMGYTEATPDLVWDFLEHRTEQNGSCILLALKNASQGFFEEFGAKKVRIHTGLLTVGEKPWDDSVLLLNMSDIANRITFSARSLVIFTQFENLHSGGRTAYPIEPVLWALHSESQVVRLLNIDLTDESVFEKFNAPFVNMQTKELTIIASGLELPEEKPLESLDRLAEEIDKRYPVLDRLTLVITDYRHYEIVEEASFDPIIEYMADLGTGLGRSNLHASVVPSELGSALTKEQLDLETNLLYVVTQYRNRRQQDGKDTVANVYVDVVLRLFYVDRRIMNDLDFPSCSKIANGLHRWWNCSLSNEVLFHLDNTPEPETDLPVPVRGSVANHQVACRIRLDKHLDPVSQDAPNLDTAYCRNLDVPIPDVCSAVDIEEAIDDIPQVVMCGLRNDLDWSKMAVDHYDFEKWELDIGVFPSATDVRVHRF